MSNHPNRKINYVIIRHGSNAANQSMCLRAAVGYVRAKSSDDAKQLAVTSGEISVYNNQHLEAIPASRAKAADVRAAWEHGDLSETPDYLKRCPMRSTIIISKRGEGYISSVSGKFGGGHSGARAGLTPYDAAAKAAQYMIEYAQSNPEGGDLMAPPEVLELVPEHLRSIPAKSG